MKKREEERDVQPSTAVLPWRSRKKNEAMSGKPAGDALILSAQGGDRTAFEQLLRLHERRVLSVALRLLRSPEDAQDASQEVFLRLYRNLARIDASRPLAPWLYRVTVNACRDFGRDRSRQQTTALDEVAEPVSTAADADPEAAYGHTEQTRQLHADLARLSSKERAALVLRDVEGLSTEEVARALDSSATTVRSQISRARLKLRRIRAARQQAPTSHATPERGLSS